MWPVVALSLELLDSLLVDVESIGEEPSLEAGEDVVVVVSLLLVLYAPSLLSWSSLLALALLLVEVELILWVTSKIESPWVLVKLVVVVADV